MSALSPARGVLARYVATRLAQALLVLWAAYTLSFLVLYALPSDPVALLAGGDATDISPEQLDALRQRYGLDQPLWVQYLLHLRGILSGDLGASISTGRPVVEVIGEAIPPTAQLAGLALIVAVLLGAGIAIAATLTRSHRLSAFLLALPPLGVAVPSFWLGLVLIQWFSFQIPLFPAMGDKGFTALVLPAITLAVPTSAAIAQLLSKSLTTALGEPYIDTAWAKGAGRVRVHLGHALRNAALPALTVTGLVVGQLLSGTVVTETVFSRPGIGRVTALAVQQQDVPVVQGIVLFAAAVFVLTTLAVDLLYPLLDPRIVLSSASPRRVRRRPADATAPAPLETAAL
ncbi:ABC transporter permease [Microbacterium trichothecenolyticum]|uniref:Peptide/nickel transport system permease protein n=1 Tax=Microbacterium trichothecenolyticum TaxID=69370 RepID=A0ABU0TW28_MICTR|nr:ABC transporter permease [Microbacterium trichothecenolyticum]MDQ1123720.1 peptide/nickel transport system permease protein [Microbacterium trichothecenolyticum]